HAGPGEQVEDVALRDQAVHDQDGGLEPAVVGAVPPQPGLVALPDLLARGLAPLGPGRAGQVGHALAPSENLALDHSRRIRSHQPPAPRRTSRTCRSRLATWLDSRSTSPRDT